MSAKENSHLIIGNSADYHAVAVLWALKKIGYEAIIWDGIGSEKDSSLSVRPFGPNSGLKLGDAWYERFASVWFRRAIRYRQPQGIAEHSLEYVKSELKYAHGSLCAMALSMSDFVVCGPEKELPSDKAYHLRMAVRCGFDVPDTLISNDCGEVQTFISRYERVAVKHFLPHFWNGEDQDSVRVGATAVINGDSLLGSQSVQACPSIFQKYIEKRHELRVTVIGKNIFAAKIERKGGGQFVDWRLHFGSTETVISMVELSENLTKKILTYMEVLNLTYGCIDLVVDENGNDIFIEINPTGQFMFIEQAIPEFNLLRAFVSMLISGRTDYQVIQKYEISAAEFEKTEEFKGVLEARRSIYV